MIVDNYVFFEKKIFCNVFIYYYLNYMDYLK